MSPGRILQGRAREVAKALSRSLAERQLERAVRARPVPPTSRPIAVLTGASGGVGRATAARLAQVGYDVALLARGEAGLAGADKEVEAAGGRALVLPTDVADFEQVSAAAGRVEEEMGPISLWVNDAMTTVFSPFSEIAPGDFKRAIEVTFLGQVWGTMVALEKMKPRGSGSIVNVGSALAFVGIPLQSAYCSAKFACRGFFESVRAELIHENSGISMSMVHLPAVNTPQFDWCATTMDRHPQPVPPIYEPEIPAALIVQAALDQRREKVVGVWNKILVVAGRLVPGLGNQYAAIGAWSTQLADIPVDKDRPVNLRHPVDAGSDHGSHGIFDDKAGGTLDPSFLASLPETTKNFVMAAAATAREKIEVRRRHRPTRP